MRLKPDKEDWYIRFFIIAILFYLLITLCFPFIKLIINSFQNSQDEWIGLKNYINFFIKENSHLSFFNSIFISTITTIITVILAYVYTYSIIHRKIFASSFFKLIAILPLFVPTMMHGLALIYLFGNKGLITTGFFGLLGSNINLNLEIYGAKGIIISEIIYTFPQAVLILSIAFSQLDQRLYDSSKSLGIDKFRSFFYITLSQTKYGIFAAMVMTFVLSFTDFGAPKIIGGKYEVLAVEIYKNVIGLKDFQIGSVISIIITLPLIFALIIDRWIQKRQSKLATSNILPYHPDSSKKLNIILFIFVALIASLILILILVVFFSSLVKIWPYSLIQSESIWQALTFTYYNFNLVEGMSFKIFWNTLLVSFMTAIIGTIIAFTSAYFYEKHTIFGIIRKSIYFFSMIPLALPGLVIGFSYILFFNQQDVLNVYNPFSVFYNTPIILILANITHFFSVSFILALTSLKKNTKEIEKVSKSLKIPFYLTFFRVTIPINFQAIIEMIIYFFINSMVTISAVIFLYPADFSLASIAIVHLDESGDTQIASAVSILLFVTNLFFYIILKWIKKKSFSENR